MFPAETYGIGKTSPAYEKGFRYQTGFGVPRDYNAAISYYSAAEKEGDARAINNLGVMALDGRGSNVDTSKAFKYFTRAKDAGSSSAAYNLGLMYDLGIGRVRDEFNATMNLKIAAEMGHPLAQYRLAQLYETGGSFVQVVNPEREAIRLYQMAGSRGNRTALARLRELGSKTYADMPADKASEIFAIENCGCEAPSEKSMAARGVTELRRLADEGDAPSRYNLAVRFLNGDDATQDPSEAARLMTLAARQGYAPAQRQLAQMYLRGQAVGASKILAHAWLNLAARDKGIDGIAAAGEMEVLERSMSTQDIREAQKVARSGALKGR